MKTDEQWRELAGRQLAFEKAVHDYWKIAWPRKGPISLGPAMTPAEWNQYEERRKAKKAEYAEKVTRVYDLVYSGGKDAPSLSEADALVESYRKELLPELQDPRITEMNAAKADGEQQFYAQPWQIHKSSGVWEENGVQVSWRKVYHLARDEYWFVLLKPFRGFRPWREGDEKIKSFSEVGEITPVTLNRDWSMNEVKTPQLDMHGAVSKNKYYTLDFVPLGREPENIEEYIVYRG